jgi:chemotaxis protein methyltransferase CheR
MTSISKEDFSYITSLVREEAAIVLESGKEYLVESRLGVLAKTEGLEGLVPLIQQLRLNTNQVLKKKVVEAMTTNETSFFRDIDPFEALKNDILPPLIENRAASKRLNIWCGAASTGQEPYTIAMVLHEHFPQLKTWNIRFDATDINKQVLDRAQQGIYSQLEVNRGLPVTFLVKYFKKEDTTFRISNDLTKLISFKEMNLVKPWPHMPTYDVIFLRNVLIYFDVETKKQILSNIKKILAPDGFLFLGSAETTIGLDQQFKRIACQRGSCYQVQ